MLNAEMEAIRKELAQTDQEKDEKNEKVNVIQAQIEKVEVELNELYSKKDVIREAFWESKYHYRE